MVISKRLHKKYAESSNVDKYLRECFTSVDIEEDVYVDIILNIFAIIKSGAIVDWYKNLDVKRRIMSSIDDYLYDAVKKGRGMSLTDEQMKKIVSSALTLAENNYEIFI